MAKKEVYYWRGENGRGELLIDRTYIVGEKIPHEKMHKSTFEKMLSDGRIQKTAFDVEDSNEVSDLQKKVKELEAKLAEATKADNSAELKELQSKVGNLEAELAAKNEELEMVNGIVAELEAKIAAKTEDSDIDEDQIIISDEGVGKGKGKK